MHIILLSMIVFPVISSVFNLFFGPFPAMCWAFSRTISEKCFLGIARKRIQCLRLGVLKVWDLDGTQVVSQSHTWFMAVCSPKNGNNICNNRFLTHRMICHFSRGKQVEFLGYLNFEKLGHVPIMRVPLIFIHFNRIFH